MANEIQWRGTETGVTLYATIRSASGTQWNTAGTPNFEAVTAANWADYDIALAESSGNYFYVGTFPAISGNMVAGWYWVDVYKRAGGAPAITDVLQGTVVGYWDGNSLLPWASKTNAMATGVVDAASIANGAIDAATFAADVDAEILSYIVDDATRIDASSLNTAAVTSVPAILADTDELQKAITDGGRTDLLIDAIKAKTDLMLDAAAIRAAVGLAGANLDTQLADLPTVAEFEARTLVAAAYGTAANQTTIAAYIDTEVAAILAAVDTEVAAIKAKTDNLPSDPADQSAVEAAITAVQSHGDTTWATATSVTVSDKTGFKLASDGLDSVATTAPTGPATNFREMVIQTWRRWFKRATRTYSGGTQQIVTYADNGTTPVTTQTISDDGTTETQGVAS